ncbi:Protein cereblon [Lamellibrachia satsuma]|nr:Protein cereblon [Lamellibrachia satsuma]
MVQKIYTVPTTILKVKKNNSTSTLTCHCLEHIHIWGMTLRNCGAGPSMRMTPTSACPSSLCRGSYCLPGQTLPLNLFQPSTVSMMSHVVEGDKTFGIVTSSYHSNDPYRPQLAAVGTTAEVLAVKEENDPRMGMSTMRVKAMGRQRFEMKDTRRQVDGNIIAKVRILPESFLCDPLEGARPASHRRILGSASWSRMDNHMASGDRADRAMSQVTECKCRQRKVDRLSCANFTQWPPWVYRQYDAFLLMSKIRTELQSWNETLKPETMPCEPSEFSFWVAANLLLDDAFRLHLLTIDSAIQRLRCELSIMRRCTVLCCKNCNLLIAKKEDVFSMALEGPMGAYVNPGGYVHETLTIYKATGLRLIGWPSTENSWFPGYAWTIAQCSQCNSHLGWKFTVAERGSLKPEKFWGLCRSSLVPGLQKDTDDSEDEIWKPVM